VEAGEEQIVTKGRTVVWPNFFIVGAPKCGTTSLYAHLKRHPQVFLPDMKEPHFFVTDRPPSRDVSRARRLTCVGNQDKYLRLYEAAVGIPAIGDASSTYLWDPNAAERIREICPLARIVICLRDPVVRAHSHFLMNRRIGMESLPTFERAIQADLTIRDHRFWGGRLYIEFGRYHEQVRRYLETFGRDQILIVLFDELTKLPQVVLARVTRHLGIRSLPAEEGELSKAHNPFRMPRFGAMYRFVTHRISPELRRRVLPDRLRAWLGNNSVLYSAEKPLLDLPTRKVLQEIYDPDIAALEALLARPLPELRESWV